MRTKTDLDYKVAGELGVSVTQVSSITRAFLDEVRNALVNDGQVSLTGVGKLTARLETGGYDLLKNALNAPMRIKLYFSKSATLKKQIERKYGLSKD